MNNRLDQKPEGQVVKRGDDEDITWSGILIDVAPEV